MRQVCRYGLAVLALAVLLPGAAVAQVERTLTLSATGNNGDRDSTTPGLQVDEGDIVTMTLTISGVTDDLITNTSSFTGTATTDQDYVSSGMASGVSVYPGFAFRTGTLTQEVSITITDDTTPEGDETFTVTVPTRNTIASSSSDTLARGEPVTVTIRANDGSQALLGGEDGLAAEGGTINVPVEFIGETRTAPSTVTFAITGTASRADYMVDDTASAITFDTTAATGTIEIAETADSGAIPIGIVTDAADPGETLIVTLTGHSGAGVTGRVSSAPRTYTIVGSDDTAPAFDDTVGNQVYDYNVAITALTLPEATGGNGTLTYALTGSLPAGLTFTDNTRVLSGTPTTIAVGVRLTYTAVDSDVNMAAADAATRIFRVTVRGAITLAAVGSGGDRDSTAPGLQVNEGDTITLTVHFPGKTGGTVRAFMDVTGTAEYRLSTSAEGSGYDIDQTTVGVGRLPTARLISVSIGQETEIVHTFDVTSDGRVEGDETVTFTINGYNGEGWSIGAPNSVTITILGDGSEAVLGGADMTVFEGSTVNFPIEFLGTTRSAISTVSFSVTGTASSADYTVAGSGSDASFDASAGTGSIDIGTEQTSVSVPIAIVSDSTPDPGETIVVTLTGHTGAANYIASSAPRTYTTAEPPPDFGGQTVDDLTYIVSQAITTALTLPEATGRGSVSYSLLPASGRFGFSTGSVDGSIIILSGTPSTIGSTVMTYTATDSHGGSAALTFRLTVEPAPGTETAPAFADGVEPPAQTYAFGPPISALTLPAAAGGDGMLFYALTPVPGGLSFDADTRIVSGTPASVMGAVTLTYTVSDSDTNTAASDTDTLTFSIAVPGTAPAFADGVAPPDQVYTVGIPSGVLTLPEATGGDGRLNYTITPNLATAVPGLRFNPSNLELAGTPTMVVGAVELTYTASDSDTDTAASDTDTLTFRVTVRDAISIALSPAALTVTEGTSDTYYTVALNSAPDGNVTITTGVTPTASDLTLAPGGALIFTAANWNTRQTVTVTAAGDAGGRTSTITHTASGANYNGMTSELPVSITERPSVGFSPATYSVSEGGTLVNVCVGVTMPAVGTINGSFAVQVSTSDGTAIAPQDYGPLTDFVLFTRDDPRRICVNIALIDDTMREGSETFMVRISGIDRSNTVSGLMIDPAADTATVTILDNDNPGVTLSPTALTVTEGATSAYTVALATSPAGDVTVTPASGNTAVATVTGALIFTTATWNTAQTVTVTAPADSNVVDDTATITHAVAGYGSVTAGPVTVTVADNNDTAPDFGAQNVPTQVYTLNVAIPTLTLPEAVGGDGGLTYTLTPAVVPGLTYDANTRTLRGTPTEVRSGTLTYTASDNDASTGAADTDTLTFILRVEPAAGAISLFVAGGNGDRDLSTPGLQVNEGDIIRLSALFRGKTGGIVDVTVGTSGTATPRLTGSATDSYDVESSSFGASPSFVITNSGDNPVVTHFFTVTDDSRAENDEVINFQLAMDAVGRIEGVTGADTWVVGTPSSVSVTILGSDASVAVLRGADATVVEGSTINVPVGFRGMTRTVRSDIAFSITGTVSSADYTVATGTDARSTTVSFDATAATGTISLFFDTAVIPIAIALDAADSGETLIVTLTGHTSRGTDDTFVSPAPRTYTITDAPPDFGGQRVNNQFYFIGGAIPTLTLPEASSSLGAVSYSLTPTTAYNGLMFSDSSRELSGTPAAAATNVLTYTATGTDGVTTSLTFSVVAAMDTAPDFGSQMVDDRTYTRTMAISTMTLPPATGGNGDLVYTLAPNVATAIPGLAFNANTRQLSGTPTTVVSAVTLTYTVTDSDPNNAAGDTDTLTFSVTVEPEPDFAPDFGSESLDNQVYTTGVGIPAQTLPQATGGEGTLVYTLTPDVVTAIPGLAFDAGTRRLSGTPTTATGAVMLTYTVRDTDANNTAADTDTLTFSVTVQMSPITVGPTALTVSEDASIPYTLVLNSAPSGNVTITPVITSIDPAPADVDHDLTLTPGGALIFTPANWNTIQTITIAAARDDDYLLENILISHVATGAGYDAVSVGDVQVLALDPVVVGFESASYVRREDIGLTQFDVCIAVTGPSRSQPLNQSVSLSLFADDGTATAGLSFPHDFRPLDSEGSLVGPFRGTIRRACENIGILDNQVQDGDRTFTLRLIQRPGSGGHPPTINPAVTTITIQDDEVAGIDLSRTTAVVAEGVTGIYTVVLLSQPLGNVTVTPGSSDTAVATVSGALTFAPAAWSTAQTITITGAEDSGTDVNVATITHTVAGYVSPTRGDTQVSVTVPDNDGSPGVVISETALTVVEGSAATYTVVLFAEPNGAVTVTPGSSDTSVAIVSAAMIFTSSNWYIPQTVTADGISDLDAIAETVTIAHAVSGAGNYAGITAGDVTFAVTDTDTASVVVGAASLMTIEEGATATYTIVLTSEPAGGDAVITLSSSDTAVATVTGSLIFNTGNWNTAQTVTVTGVDDPDATVEASVTITHTVLSGGDYDGLPASAVTVMVAENDMASIVQDSPPLRVGEGSTVAYTIGLTSAPDGGNVVITPSSSDTAVATVTGALTFTAANWNTVRTVTITGVDDPDATVEAPVTITNTVTSTGDYASLTAGDVTVTVAENDMVSVVLDSAPLSLEEGTTTVYTIGLTSAPDGGEVVITPGSGNTAVVTVTGALTFTAANWNTVRTVTVTAAYDYDANVEAPVTITHALVSAGDYGSLPELDNVVVTVVETDVASVTISQSSLTMDEGATGTYTVVLTSEPNNDVVIAPGSSDAAVATVTGALTFTTATWNTGQTVTVAAIDDDDSSTEIATVTHAVSGYGSVTADPVVVTVTDLDPDTEPGFTEDALNTWRGRAYSYTRNNLIPSLTLPEATSGNGAPVYTLTPLVHTTIPGLTFDPGTRVLSGIPTEVSADVTLTYVATDVDGDPTATVINFMVAVVENRDTEGMTDLNRLILPEVARALADHRVSAIAQRIRRAGDNSAQATRNLTIGGQTTLSGMALTHGRAFAEGTLDMNTLLGGSEFVLPLHASEVGRATGLSGVTLWGGGDYRALEGKGDGINWDGDMFSAHLGVDAHLRDDVLAGVAVSWSDVDLGYTQAGFRPGEYNVDLTSVHPYLGWTAPSGRLDLWATVGYGWGELEITRAASPSALAMQAVSDVTMQTAGAGGSAKILEGRTATVRLKGEAMQTLMEVEGSDRIAALRVKARRFRVGLEASHTHRMAGGSQLVPTLEVGVRHDAGDGRTGTGAEVGGGMRYTDEANGLTVESHGRILLGHTGDYKDWGIGGAVRLSAGRDGHGLSFSLLPTWGATASRASQVWAQEAAATVAAATPARQNGQVALKMGYGVGWDESLVTPYGQVTLSNIQTRAYRLGSRMRLGDRLLLNLEGTRQETAARAVDHGVLLKIDLTF